MGHLAKYIYGIGHGSSWKVHIWYRSWGTPIPFLKNILLQIWMNWNMQKKDKTRLPESEIEIELERTLEASRVDLQMVYT